MFSLSEAAGSNARNAVKGEHHGKYFSNILNTTSQKI